MPACAYARRSLARSLARADPYHTYLSSAMLAIYCAEPAARGTDPRWALAPLDPLLNARQDTARWAREHIGGRGAARGAQAGAS